MGAHEETLAMLTQFVAERDWDRFHTPANLAKSISIEAAELLEHYQWNDTGADEDEVRDELADVLTYCFLLASKMGWDVEVVSWFEGGELGADYVECHVTASLLMTMRRYSRWLERRSRAR